MDTKQVGRFIAYNRRKKGLTQEQLGERLGVSNKTVSRWENGNYMPDLSLLEPLSRELDVTLNELLAGEAMEKEKTAEATEKNLRDAIAYSAEKIRDQRRLLSLLFMGLGVWLCIRAFAVSPPESPWSAAYSIAGLLLVAAGLFREWKTASVRRRLAASGGVFLLLLALFVTLDCLGAAAGGRAPVYRYRTERAGDIVAYYSPFLRVFQVHAGAGNEYCIVDREKELTVDTVPISPFNREKSGIDALLRFENQYIGNNSNTGGLINALPLSEYGYVFEIDSENLGLTIDYHFTDWYGNENLYVDRGLVYNSVCLFALIDNLQSVRFNFSGSTYVITRESVEENYPDYAGIFAGGQVDKEGFNRYVEGRMNDDAFVEAMFALLD